MMLPNIQYLRLPVGGDHFEHLICFSQLHIFFKMVTTNFHTILEPVSIIVFILKIYQIKAFPQFQIFLV